MTGPSTTTRRTAEATLPLAIHAIATHALDHGLNYQAIEGPHQAGDPIQIRIYAEHFEPWLDSVTLRGPADRTDVNNSEHGAQRITHRAHLPSPIGNVDVELWTVVLHPTPTPGLRLVGAAS